MIEVCVDSVESAIAAQEGGADRIELCSALIIGGLSPSSALYDVLRGRGVTLPVRAMVRPRFGDFLYTAAEREVMLAETRAWTTAGVDGVVTGALKADGTLDVSFLTEFIAASPGLGHTLHRAFDLTADPFETLETAIALGFDTILTSGQSASAPAGAALIGELRRRAAGRITILAGAGVSAANLAELGVKTGCTAYHLSAKATLSSGMNFRREGVPMGLPGFDEYSLWRTDVDKVRAAVRVHGNLV